MNKEQFSAAIHKKLNEIGKLFDAKNDQYATNDDPLANFTRGAMLAHGRNDLCGQFEALKGYVGKHLAHVYNNKLDGHKVDESINDIIVYFIIAGVMSDLSKSNTKSHPMCQCSIQPEIPAVKLDQFSRIKRIETIDELMNLDGEYVLAVERIEDDYENYCDMSDGTPLLHYVNATAKTLTDYESCDWDFEYLNDHYFAFEILNEGDTE